MKMPRFRCTVRRLMIVILACSIALHFAATARRVDSTRVPHLHTGIIEKDPLPSGKGTYPTWFTALGQRQPFWPCYWRASIGLSWRKRVICPKDGKLLLEECELEHPEIRKILGPDSFSAINSEEQNIEYVKLLNENGQDARYINGSIHVRARKTTPDEIQ
jgi:hypothetical protein